jgi:hypothetical protein
MLSVSRKFNYLLQTDYLWHYYYDTNYLLVSAYLSTHQNMPYKSLYVMCYKIELLTRKLGINKSICSTLKLSELLSSNNIKIIPPEIGLLVNLQQLDLRDNQISSIPSEIGLLTNLQQLNLSDNQIRSIPSEIGQLANLQYLFLGCNQIRFSLYGYSYRFS